MFLLIVLWQCETVCSVGPSVHSIRIAWYDGCYKEAGGRASRRTVMPGLSSESCNKGGGDRMEHLPLPLSPPSIDDAICIGYIPLQIQVRVS